VENDGKRKFESVYSNKVKAGKRRTYFFDVRQTKGNDYYITLTESTKKFNGSGYERHKIFLYKEDFNRFFSGLEDAINHVKTELMPDFDYEQYERREEEWEQQQLQEQQAEKTAEKEPSADPIDADTSGEEVESDDDIESEEDMSW
jgi:hypothetical protein